MSYHKYIPVSKEFYDVLTSRYLDFLEFAASKTKEPVNVFDPLSAKQMEELILIREISTELQKQKEEDAKKAEAAAAAAEKASEEKEQMEETKETEVEQEPVKV